MPQLIVNDTKVVISILADYARKCMTGKVISVTGSAGKTTTKNFIAKLLSHYGSVEATYGSQNALGGINSLMARGIYNPDYTVCEICSHILYGRIQTTLKRVLPHISVITSVCLTHGDEFGITEESGIAKIKSVICQHMQPGGIGVINHDMSTYDIVLKEIIGYGAKPVTFGFHPASDARIISTTIIDDKQCIRAKILNKEVEYTINYLGDGMATNSLAALTVLELLGINSQEASQYLSEIKTESHRQQFVKTPSIEGGEATIIDDCFNSPPLSVIEALGVLKKIEAQKKVAVVGKCVTYQGLPHKYLEFVDPIIESGAETVILIDKELGTIAPELVKRGVKRLYCFENEDEAAVESIVNTVTDGSLVLMKLTSVGHDSNNMALKVIRRLRNVNK
jgi:UDP-N-acetylmuramoyl-tripeptide--D-alanyl-D-alanine ligase